MAQMLQLGPHFIDSFYNNIHVDLAA